MTFEHLYALFVGGIFVLAGVVLYVVHRLTCDCHVPPTEASTTRRDPGPDRVTVLRGGAGHPSAGTSASNGPRHARAA